MKKQIGLLLLAALLAGGMTADTARAAQGGGEVKKADAEFMLPLRTFAEELGYKVVWKDGAVTVTKGGVEMRVVPGRTDYPFTRAQKDGVVIDESFTLPAAPYVKNGVTYVPADAIVPLLKPGESLTVSGETVLTGKERKTVKQPAKTETKSGNGTASPAEKKPAASAKQEASDKTAAETANPFHDYDSMDEASSAAGFTFTLPAIGADYESVAYRAVPGELLEVIYGHGGGEALRLRKGADLSNVSGDYGSYKTIKTIAVDGINVRMKGNGNRISLATWERDGHAYAASAGEPLTIGQMMSIVREMV